MNTELKLFENVCKINDEIIKTKDSITSVVFIIQKGNVETIGLIWRNAEEKEEMRINLLKRIAETKDLIGYILIFDTKMTTMNKEDINKSLVQDAVMRNLFTSKEIIKEIVIYENHKILSKKIIKSKRDKKEELGLKDRWDFWGDSEMEDKIVNDYNKFKLNNKEKYK